MNGCTASGCAPGPASSASGLRPARAPRRGLRAVDISERKDAYLVTVELPGVGTEDVEITFEDGLLTIQGERHFAHDSAGEKVHRIERRYGAFRRSITLPSHVQADKIEASAQDGVLLILVPKAPRSARQAHPGTHPQGQGRPARQGRRHPHSGQERRLTAPARRPRRRTAPPGRTSPAATASSGSRKHGHARPVPPPRAAARGGACLGEKGRLPLTQVPGVSCSGSGDGGSKLTSTCSKSLRRWALACLEYARRSPVVRMALSVNGVSSDLG